MTYKSFVISTVSLVVGIVGALSAFIYYIDPLWLFGTSHEYNDVQVAFNERQQKMNHIYYQPFEYDTLLLGSSRSTYINQHDFEGMDVYNFAVSNISVREYNAFIEIAKEKEMKVIALCDHDSVQGVSAIIEEGKKEDIQVIPSIECTTLFHDYECHLLGYNIDINHPYFHLLP